MDPIFYVEPTQYAIFNNAITAELQFSGNIMVYAQTGTDNTYANVDELIYTSTENAYTPGDNGAGLIYTYLGIPKETVPKASGYGMHCWRKTGYSYPIISITNTNKTTALTFVNTASMSVGNYGAIFAGYNVTLNSSNKITIASPRVFTITYTPTADSYGDPYKKISFIADSWNE
jgi:hypothetical protein